MGFYGTQEEFYGKQRIARRSLGNTGTPAQTLRRLLRQCYLYIDRYYLDLRRYRQEKPRPQDSINSHIDAGESDFSVAAGAQPAGSMNSQNLNAPAGFFFLILRRPQSPHEPDSDAWAGKRLFCLNYMALPILKSECNCAVAAFITPRKRGAEGHMRKMHSRFVHQGIVQLQHNAIFKSSKATRSCGSAAKYSSLIRSGHANKTAFRNSFGIRKPLLLPGFSVLAAAPSSSLVSPLFYLHATKAPVTCPRAPKARGLPLPRQKQLQETDRPSWLRSAQAAPTCSQTATSCSISTGLRSTEEIAGVLSRMSSQDIAVEPVTMTILQAGLEKVATEATESPSSCPR